VATLAQGMTVTWDGTPFKEVTDIQWTYGGGPSKGRAVLWTDDLGSVQISCFGTTNTETNKYGERKQLQILGGGANLTTFAVWESLSVTPELNGVTRYSLTFKVLDG
jgi:hypothetical protein